MASFETMFKDLMKATRPAFLKGDGKIQNVFTNNNYEIINNWFYGDKETITGGSTVEFLAKVRKQAVARHITDLEEDDTKITNTLEKASVPWVIANTSWGFTKTMMLDNRGSAQKLADVIKAQRLNALEDLSDLLEAAAFLTPASANDRTTPCGIPYWVPLGTSGAEGWLGTNPSGLSDCAGIDSSLEANAGWRSFSARNGYTAVDAALLAIMERVYRVMRFKAPKLVADLASDPAIKKFKIYCPGAVVDSYAALMRTLNAQVGEDSAKFADKPTFKGHPLVWLEGLDSNNKAPLYFLDMSCFGVKVKEGDFFSESEPVTAPKQHRVMTVNVDTSYNFICTNRRKQGVIAKA